MRVSVILSHRTSAKYTAEWRNSWAFPSRVVHREGIRRGRRDPSQVTGMRAYVRFGRLLLSREFYRQES